MRDLELDVLVSEKFAISVLANHYHINKYDIEHVSELDKTNPIDLRYNNMTYDVKFSNPTLDSKRKILRRGILIFDIKKIIVTFFSLLE